MPDDINLADYAEFMPKATNETMSRVEALLETRDAIQKWVDKYSALMEKANKRLKQIDEDELPEIADELGQDEFRLKNSGLKIKIVEQLFASIPAQSTIDKCKDDEERQQMQRRRDDAMTWIEDNAPDVVKRRFDIQFGRNDEKLAAKFERDLAQRKNPIPVVRSATVEWQTLNALVRDRTKAGLPVPKDLLGVYPKRVAKIYK